MDSKKMYGCIGYNFKPCNDHLLGSVGDTHTLDEWTKIAYPGKDVASFFEHDSNSYICNYLLKNMGIRLTLIGKGKKDD